MKGGRTGGGKAPPISRRASWQKSQVALIYGRDENGNRLGAVPPQWQLVLLGAIVGLKRALQITKASSKGASDTPSERRARWIDVLQAIGTGLMNTGEFDDTDVADVVAMRGALIDLERGLIAAEFRSAGGSAKVGWVALRYRGFAARAVDVRAAQAGESLTAARDYVAKQLNKRDAASKLGLDDKVSDDALKKMREHAMAGSPAEDADAEAFALIGEWAASEPSLTVERVLNVMFGPPIVHTPAVAAPLRDRGD